MCEKRVATLKKLSTKPALIPVCTVAPEPGVPLQPNVGAPNLLRPVHRKSTTQKVSEFQIMLCQLFMAMECKFMPWNNFGIELFIN